MKTILSNCFNIKNGSEDQIVGIKKATRLEWLCGADAPSTRGNPRLIIIRRVSCKKFYFVEPSETFLYLKRQFGTQTLLYKPSAKVFLL